MRQVITMIIAALVTCAVYGRMPSGGLQRTVVCGEVHNLREGSSRVITAIDCNPGANSGRHAVKIDSAGRFHTYVELLYGHTFTTYYDGAFLCSYAEPGDSLYLTIDANRLDEGAVYGGDHSELNNEYGPAYARLFGSFCKALQTEGLSEQDCLNFVKDTHKANLETIKTYADSTNMSEECRDLLERTAFLSMINVLTEYKGTSPANRLTLFSDPVFGIDDHGNAKEMMLPYHLWSYLFSLADAKGIEKLNELVDSVASRHEPSLNRDIMFTIIAEMASDSGEDMEIDSELFYDSLIHDKLYNPQKEDRHAAEPHNLAKGTICRLNDGNMEPIDYNGLTEMLRNEYKGKTVYLDLWATWCGPCRAAHKSLPEVADYFKNKEDLVFVTVAMKSDTDTWSKLSAEFPANCHSYIVTSDDAAELIMSEYNMRGFPTYLIIGKDGSIVDHDPPRPHNAKIYDRLIEILGNE